MSDVSEPTPDELPEDDAPINVVLDDLTSGEPQTDDSPVCGVCGEEFRSVGGRRRHQTTTHGMEPSTPTKAKAKSSGGGSGTGLELQLRSMFVTIAVGVSFYNQQDGQAVLLGAENMAKAWADLAKTNKTVDRVLRSMVATSAWGEVGMAMMPMVVAIAANHNAINPLMAGMVGMPVPEPKDPNDPYGES